jgi:uncharacterized membrane protein HdeD (DUF308 family)
MLTMLARNWWVVALRGLFAIVFGILAIVWPSLTLLVLITLFGAYALADGIFAVIAGIASYGRNERWWAMLLEGIAGIILGVLTFLWPGTTALVLVYFIAAWAMITGVFEIAPPSGYVKRSRASECWCSAASSRSSSARS